MTGILLDLGRVEYGRALDIQRKLAEERASDLIPNVLVLLEHEHVVTLGRKTSSENFRPQRIPVFEVERGGDATYHGPGQVVGYPIIKLVDHDVRRHVRVIEEALISVAERWGIKAGLAEGHPGIWVDGKKLASIGVAVSNWVTFHGFALNVSTDMSYFELIRPCGLEPQTMTSMKAILGSSIDFEEVKDAVRAEYCVAAGESFVVDEAMRLTIADKRK